MLVLGVTMSGVETSIANVVRTVVDSLPHIRACLSERIVNFSELARRMKPLVESVLGRPVSVDSIKVALIRYSEALKKSMQKKIEVLEVLARSALEVRTGISVLTVRISALPMVVESISRLAGRSRFLAFMQSPSVATLIVDNESLDSVLEYVPKDQIVELYRDYAALILVSPPEIITTPGVVEYVTGLLAREGINIVQIESCYTDTVMIVSKQDMLKAFTVLNEAIENARRWLASDKQSHSN